MQIKRSGDERKKIKSTSNERGRFSKPNSTAENSSKAQTSGLCQKLGTFPKMDKGRNQIYDQRTRKLMTKRKALHTRCISRKVGRELENIEDRVDSSIRRIKDYIKKRKK